MGERTCSVEGCDRKHYGWGLCNMHWSRMKTRGTTDAPELLPKTCQADGCEKRSAARGLCAMHYRRLKVHGELEPPPPAKRELGPCAVESCERVEKTSGLCNAHYQRYLRCGDPLGNGRWHEGCKVDGCDEPHLAHGYCRRHDYRYRTYGDPLVTSRAVPRDTPPPCPADGCMKPARSFSATYCEDHIGSYRYTPPSVPREVKPRALCSMDECGDPVSGLGFCVKHYQRLKRHGDPSIVNRTPTRYGEKAPCVIESCGRVANSRGLCTRHYNQYLLSEHFTPADGPPPCAVEGCGRKHFAHGYCSTHSKRLMLTGDAHEHLPIGWALPKPLVCTVSECQRWQVAPGVCIVHYGFKRGWSVWDLLEDDGPEQMTDDYIAVIHGDPCVHCGEPMQHVDHIYPRSKGGPDLWSNFAPACQSCNCSKHATHLLQYMMRRLDNVDPLELPIGA